MALRTSSIDVPMTAGIGATMGTGGGVVGGVDGGVLDGECVRKGDGGLDSSESDGGASTSSASPEGLGEREGVGVWPSGGVLKDMGGGDVEGDLSGRRPVLLDRRVGAVVRFRNLEGEYREGGFRLLLERLGVVEGSLEVPALGVSEEVVGCVGLSALFASELAGPVSVGKSGLGGFGASSVQLIACGQSVCTHEYDVCGLCLCQGWVWGLMQRGLMGVAE